MKVLLQLIEYAYFRNQSPDTCLLTGETVKKKKVWKAIAAKNRKKKGIGCKQKKSSHYVKDLSYLPASTEQWFPVPRISFSADTEFHGFLPQNVFRQTICAKEKLL